MRCEQTRLSRCPTAMRGKQMETFAYASRFLSELESK